MKRRLLFSLIGEPYPRGLLFLQIGSLPKLQALYNRLNGADSHYPLNFLAAVLLVKAAENSTFFVWLTSAGLISASRRVGKKS